MTTGEPQMLLEPETYLPPTVFFAYPSKPEFLSETIKDAAAAINKTRVASVRTWEEMSVTGKNIMSEICREISSSQILCADITGLNPNVLFELGYAISRNKRIWPVIDSSFFDLKKQFDQLRLLATTGYAPYTNADHIASAFLKERPYLDLDNTIFRQSIEPTISISDAEIILYLKSHVDTNAGIRISKALKESDVPLILDDPNESAAQTLAWYGQKIYSSVAVIAHFLSPNRDGAKITNSKYAFISGLAHGLDKPLLMLAEPEYSSPLDYREILFNYKTATDAVRYLKEWLSPIEKAYREKVVRKDQVSGTLRQKLELRDFYVQIGEYLAENETNDLANYYVETTAYHEALAGKRRIFVGRKGSGKTANLVALQLDMSSDKDKVVCVLQPVGYEIESLLRLLNFYKEHDTKAYAIESLWKFLLLTEIANATALQIENRPLWVEKDSDEIRLLKVLDEHQTLIREDFSIRLERCVSALLDTGQSTSVEQQRKGISEALHETVVKNLRTALDDVLSKKSRVAILIDNLDKAWVKQADIAQMAEFLQALFSAGNQLITDFARKDSRRKAVNCTAAIFLRTDIFQRISEIAREPDKLAVTRLIWNDPETLSRVVESRYEATHTGSDGDHDVWSRYFSASIKGRPAKNYILSRTLPRPRDVVYLVKTAIAFAVNRGHPRVEEDDVIAAEYEYSKYAKTSVMVENGITLPQLEKVLYEFMGAQTTLTLAQASEILLRAGIPQTQTAKVIDHLVGLSFLGLEVGRGQFVYAEDLSELKKYTVLSDKLAEEQRSRRYMIHPAFRAYLEVIEED